MKVAFDVGGVVTRYPRECRELIQGLVAGGQEVYFVTDVTDRDKVVNALRENAFDVRDRTGKSVLDNVITARYSRHGDACKAVVLRDLGIEVFVDDHLGYLMWPWPTRAPLRLLVVPDPRRSYYVGEWCGESTEWTGAAYTDPDDGSVSVS